MRLTGMLFGTFDGLHMGHVFLIQQALERIKKKNIEYRIKNIQNQEKASNASRLYIVVGRDSTVAGVKGVQPKLNERERMQAIKNLFPECRVVLGHKTNRMYWLRKVQPDVVFLGYDQKAFVDVLKQEMRRQQKASLKKVLGSAPQKGLNQTFSRELSAAGGSDTAAHQTKIIRLKPFKEATYKSSKIKTPHILLRGGVVHGKKIGRSIGYPTANIRLTKATRAVVVSRNLHGIYASRVLLGTRSYIGATVVGARTHEGGPLVETHIIGYTGDCYGKTLTISLEKKLRDFKTYTTSEALVRDIERDIQNVQRFFMRRLG